MDIDDGNSRGIEDKGQRGPRPVLGVGHRDKEDEKSKDKEGKGKRN